MEREKIGCNVNCINWDGGVKNNHMVGIGIWVNCTIFLDMDTVNCMKRIQTLTNCQEDKFDMDFMRCYSKFLEKY